MNEMYMDIPRVYTALAEWAACCSWIFVSQRRFSGKITAATAGSFLAAQTVFLVVTDDLPIAWWIPCMAMAVGLMYLLILCICEMRPLEAGYCCAWAFLVAEFAASLEWQIQVWLFSVGISEWQWMILVLLAVYISVMAGAVRLTKSFFANEYLSQISLKEFVSAAGIAVVVFTFSNFAFVVRNTPFNSEFQSDILVMRTVADMGGLAVLCAFQSRVCECLAEKEADAVQAALNMQYEQYRSYQDSLELLHIKYHDLKHQIAMLRSLGSEDERSRWIDAMENELEMSGPLLHTGNRVLDALIGRKILYGRKNGIRFTTVIDGALLDFMHVTDICSIFGNALDNAVRSVMMTADPQKRLIDISVTAQRNFIYIEIANYCEENLEWEKGKLPESTKSDRKNHGFGLKSICYSAEKYGGRASVSLKENWFELHVLIPGKQDVPEHEKQRDADAKYAGKVQSMPESAQTEKVC